MPAVLAFAALFLFAGHAHAAYIEGDLINDNFFTDSTVMDQASIQAFLNSKGGALASQTFPTLNNGPQPAAWIVAYTARYVGLSPRTILATLQKEESLVTDPSPIASQYNFAMGYGCPDTAGCSSSESGFFNQVVDGSWQLRFNYERARGNNSTWTSPDGHVFGNASILYACRAKPGGNPWFYDTGLFPGRTVHFSDGSNAVYATVVIANAASSSLYCYTPHAYWPGHYTGSHNFVTSWNQWWGSTISNDPMGSFDLVQQRPREIRVAGWGLDGNQEGATHVNFYVDGGWGGSVTADVPRADVGSHGFDGRLPWTAAGTHRVCAWVIGDNIGSANTGIGCHYVTIANDPTGSFDLAQQRPGAVRVAGWATDPSVVGTINVHVYIDGHWAGAVPANLGRADVGLHGFDGTVPWTTAGAHSVCAWAVGDNIGSPNAYLGCHSVNINNDPAGSFDLIHAGSGSVRVAGWAVDPSLAGPANVHVYIDGHWAGAVVADKQRPDVGPHGFDGSVPWATSGTHTACLWVVGDSIGSPNMGLGCKPFSM
jgi:hypothetical protein